MERMRNKKATYNYEIIDTFEAGIELFGFEVASVKARNISFEGSYIIIDKHEEAYLKNFHVTSFQEKNTPDWYEPERPRKLLLKKKELESLAKKIRVKGQTLIPLSIYLKGRRIKIEIALVRGKNKSDKRNTIKDRESKRSIERVIKQGR